MGKKKLLISLMSLSSLGALGTSYSADFVEPDIFTSHSGKLSITMKAQSAGAPALGDGVSGWGYNICNGKVCSKNIYGGAMLQLYPGDQLDIHYENDLPPISPALGGAIDGFSLDNPTNVHFHGFLVAPAWPATPSDVSATSDINNPPLYFGDSVFVTSTAAGHPSPPPQPDPQSHVHGGITLEGKIDYTVKIPAGHPAGMSLYHPHVHGATANQLSEGLSGIMSVGSITDTVSNLPPGFNTVTDVKHLILKDAQVLSSTGPILANQDTGFCGGVITSNPLKGFCRGTDNTSNGGGDYTGGSWVFTVTGQKYPNFNVPPNGQIWRVTNASAIADYQLQLVHTDHGVSHDPMIFQVLSIDGISVTPASDNTPGQVVEMAGGRFKLVSCPGTTSNTSLCATAVHMMPGTRADLWIVNRDTATGAISNAPSVGSHATFETVGYSTGTAGDVFPAVQLASVNFQPGNTTASSTITVNDTQHNAGTGLKYNVIAAELAQANAAVGPKVNCKPLPVGWKRRIFFGYPTASTFGLGFELVDDKGQTVPGSFQDVASFPDAAKEICVPMYNNLTTYERWELVNLTAEDHNFHIHQTRFRILTKDEITGTNASANLKGVLQDSAVLLTGSNACDGTVATWKSGACVTSPIQVEIPFAIAGDFVFHCHILQHEDVGMMAPVHVSSETGP